MPSQIQVALPEITVILRKYISLTERVHAKNLEKALNHLIKSTDFLDNSFLTRPIDATKNARALLAYLRTHAGSGATLESGLLKFESSLLSLTQIQLTQPNTLDKLSQKQTTELCFELVLAISKAKNLAEAIRYIFQNDQCGQLTATFPMPLNRQQKLALANSSLPIIDAIPGIEQFSKIPASVKTLSDCVFSSDGRLVFNLTSIDHFNIRMHTRLHRNLHIIHAEFAKKIYSHNNALQLLDMRINGLEIDNTPREAIQHLITKLEIDKALRASGAEAGDLAYDAIVHFHVYCSNLPDDLTAKKTLSRIFDSLEALYITYQYPCTDRLITEAKEILAWHSHSTDLDEATPLSPETLALIKTKRTHLFFTPPQTDKAARSSAFTPKPKQ